MPTDLTAAQAELRREERRRKREEQLERMIPYDFQNNSVEASPNPVQCQFVVNDHIDQELLTEDRRECGLLLHGKTGTGKTGAMWLLFSRNWVRYPGNDQVFVRTVDFTMLSKAKHQTAAYREKFDRLFNQMLNADELYLDDLGTEKLSDATEEVFYRLLNNRFDERLETIISSNLNAAGIARLFTRKNEAKIKRRLEQFLIPINFDTNPDADVCKPGKKST